ncbi:MAG TPA: hypothetical protein VHS56_05490 [Candidatus Cybelea sp.]|nr:hypothetical protein [Candidatus Cybelea sp.]
MPNALGQTIRPDRGAKSTLLYASDANDNLVYMIDLPSGRLAGKLTGFDQPTGLCAYVKGDVYVVSSQASEILAYKHAVKSAFKELGDHPYIPVGCSIDPVTGNLALANCCGNSPDGNLAIYAHATGAAKYFSDPSMYIYWYCAYDDRGNLYVSGINHSYAYQLDVMPAGKHALNAVMLSPDIEGDVSPALQWDGKYLAIASPTAGAIWQYAVNGTQAKRVHVTKLSDAGGVLDFWIAATSQRRTLYAPILANSALSIGVYPYPKGGKPETKLYDAIDPYAVTVSAPP